MRTVKGKTRVCGLIGNPVEHSVSPLIHNTLAEMEDTDLVYVTFKVDNGCLKEAIKGASALDILGMNVTVPYKEGVLSLLDEVDPLAARIGAVNTLVRTANGYKGYNTDITGLKRELQDAGIVIEGNRVIILGAGGAARAIAFLCAFEKAEEIYILNRTSLKAEQLAAEVKKSFEGVHIEGMGLDEFDNIQGSGLIAIQTTSAGLYPDVDNTPVEAPAFYEKISVGVDIIYNPARTRFMKMVEEHGGAAYNGLKMLLYQGISAFELWTGKEISTETADSVYEVLKKELGINE